MKYLNLASIIIALLFTACGSANTDETAPFDNNSSYSTESNNNNIFSNFSKKKTVVHKVKNPQNGMVHSLVSMPSNWKIEGNKWTGPDGSEVNFYTGQSYQNSHYQNIDQIMQQVVLPGLKQPGLQVDGVIDLPEVTRNNRLSWSKFWKAMPSEDFLQAKAVEITNHTEKVRGLLVINFYYSRSSYGSYTNYNCTLLSAKPGRYEQDKKDVLHGLANMHMTPEAIAAHNQNEQMKSKQSWASHNRYMESKRALFEAGQASARTNSEISDMIYDSYKKRSDMMDATHEKFTDAIREESSAINPYTGQEFKVNQGYTYYYMNQFGQVFGTNDAFYRPENDPNINHQQWRKIRTN
ncbi:MAG: hypothetical protein MRZ79_06860 [Bacteroidia bacterium]|nr:hypothetical protein [Bacteroidia bacterium]